MKEMRADLEDRPYVIISSAMSVDGKLSSRADYSKLSCPQDLVRRDRLRSEVDAVMVGANTVIKDNPHLTVKRVAGRNPLRVILDGKLRSPPSSLVFTDKKTPTLLATTKQAPAQSIKRLQELGVEVLILGDASVDLRHLMRELGSRGVRRLMVEGGGTTNWNMVKKGLVDEVRVTISPYLFGGAGAVTLLEGTGFKDEKDIVKLHLEDRSLCECGNEVQLRYRVSRR